MTGRTGWIAALAVMLLAGCGPTELELQSMDRGRCGEFGFRPGSVEFAQCMMGLTQQRDAQAADEREAARQDSIRRDMAREQTKAREERERRAERAAYERARDRREGCERTLRPIYC